MCQEEDLDSAIEAIPVTAMGRGNAMELAGELLEMKLPNVNQAIVV